MFYILFFCDILTVNYFYYFSFSDHLLIISVQIYNFPFFSIIIFYPFRSIIFIILLISSSTHYLINCIYISIKWLVSISKCFVFYQINDYCFRVKGESVEETTNRLFKVGDRLILSKLKELCRRFGLEWNFVSSRNGKQIYRMSVLVPGSYHLLRSVVAGLFVLKIQSAKNVKMLVKFYNRHLQGSV